MQFLFGIFLTFTHLSFVSNLVLKCILFVDWPTSLGIKVKQLTQQFLIMTFWQKEIMANYEKEGKKRLPFNNIQFGVLKNFTDAQPKKKKKLS